METKPPDDPFNPPRVKLDGPVEVLDWLKSKNKTLWVQKGSPTIEPFPDDVEPGRMHLWISAPGGSRFVAKDDDGLFGMPSGIVVPPAVATELQAAVADENSEARKLS